MELKAFSKFFGGVPCALVSIFAKVFDNQLHLVRVANLGV